MKKIAIAVLIILLAGLGWYFRKDLLGLANRNLLAIKTDIKNSGIINKVEESVGQVSTPTPLVSSRQGSGSELSISGVISWTNTQRKQNGSLAPLAENKKLDAAAKAKLEDMFKQQYFEHESPQGAGPADLAKAAGYVYIAIGENLALGNFDNDKTLVQDWMDSPGHRANILNSKYEEIGVAVGEGNYQGKKVWLAVQEFGRPASSCPSVDSSLKTEMSSLQKEIDQMETSMTALKADIDSSSPKTQSEVDAYNAKVASYNSQVKIYNNKVDTLKSLTEQYNSQVKAYNGCLD
ncbi:MAG: hypothetical protein HY918_03655 [Candidatus Doudnabacteria bacterium]|nr:hypothetical protein [Candidatus Doudnabacteria bacterium]